MRRLWLILCLPLVTTLWATNWRGITPSKIYDIMLLEDFENKVSWYIKTRQSINAYGRFIKKEPLYPDSKNSYLKQTDQLFSTDDRLLRESAGLHQRNQPDPAKFSFEVQAFFNQPGHDSLELRPRRGKPHRIKGRPRSVAMWVYGVNKKHTLFALFSNHTQKVYPVKISRLDFVGWERLEVVIPPHIQRRNPAYSNQFDFQFVGLKVVSNARETPGLFLFNFDNVMVLVDREEEVYPGSKISDKWK